MAATQMDYYNLPKHATIEEIASRQGDQDHLMKAELKILRAVGPYARLAYTSARSSVLKMMCEWLASMLVVAALQSASFDLTLGRHLNHRANANIAVIQTSGAAPSHILIRALDMIEPFAIIRIPTTIMAYP